MAKIDEHAWAFMSGVYLAAVGVFFLAWKVSDVLFFQ